VNALHPIDPDARRVLRVGYLHVGRPGGGVRRYGEIIAAAAGLRNDLTVTEVVAGDRHATRSDFRRAGRHLRHVDVVHAQWKPRDWSGGGSAALGALLSFTLTTRRPLVITLHDVYPRTGLSERLVRPDAMALRWLGRVASVVVVHSREEEKRLRGLVPSRKIRVVPHFVEDRILSVTPAEAKRALGLGDRTIVSLLGFITRRKGHNLLLDALALLPDRVVAIVAGSGIGGRDVRVEELREQARRNGLFDRVMFTGHMDESRLEMVLAATDVAVCPFDDVSASGSLSTWISVARPLVVSDLPGFREYDALSPGALRRFAPRDSETLALAIRRALADTTGTVDPSVLRLRDQLSPSITLDRYAAIYRTTARSTHTDQ
jgi:glycosyltransferase involved in cell wall biosynthesis